MKIPKKSIRGLVVARETKVDAEMRTIDFAFSSEQPVERWFGNEILSHEKDAVDLSKTAGADVLKRTDA